VTVSYVPMTADDLAEVLALEARVQAFPWSLGNFRDALASGYDCRVGREDGQLVAFVVTMRAVDEVHLLVIAVAPERQRAGLARRLLDIVCAEARTAGMTRLLLEVRPSNAAALAFYNSAGCVEIGRRRGYYPAAAGREDAIVMARTL
jgi:tRNA threonylcarbamoyladenosine biosynthesis protein TsaB